MPVAINYINGIVVLPDFRVLMVKKVNSQWIYYIDDYRATFQCPLLGDENELQCVAIEIERLLGIDILSSTYSDLIKVVRVGYVSKNSNSCKILIYILQIVGTVTLKTAAEYKLRPLPFKKAREESLRADLVGYQNKVNPPPKYTNTAICVLEEIENRGGINKCIEKSL